MILKYWILAFQYFDDLICCIPVSYTHLDVYKRQLEIEDNGGGYPDDIVQNAFAIFQRGKNAKKGGLGLGLSIAKGIVDAHQGTISINNLETGGAHCRISIPCEFSYIGNLTLEN